MSIERHQQNVRACHLQQVIVVQDIKILTNEAIRETTSWLESASLAHAKHKKRDRSKSTKRRKQTLIKIRIGEQTIRSQSYLRIMIDQKLNFKSHFKSFARKATGVTTLLAEMLPNIGDLTQSWHLISKVVQLLWPIPIRWTGRYRAPTQNLTKQYTWQQAWSPSTFWWCNIRKRRILYLRR